VKKEKWCKNRQRPETARANEKNFSRGFFPCAQKHLAGPNPGPARLTPVSAHRKNQIAAREAFSPRICFAF